MRKWKYWYTFEIARDNPTLAVGGFKYQGKKFANEDKARECAIKSFNDFIKTSDANPADYHIVIKIHREAIAEKEPIYPRIDIIKEF